MIARGLLLASAALAALLLVLVVYIAALLPRIPGVAQLQRAESARPSVLVTRDGQPIASFSRAQKEPVKLAQVSPHVVHALIATEDHRFYDHHGVDLRRTVMALWRTATGSIQGGSTLTQQLARNLFPEAIGRDRSIHRKMKEMLTALRIERHFDKPQILEAYLNNAPFLYNAVGIEMAARTYFDKNASELDVVESATLVGMLKGTAYYNPVLQPERATARRNLVLGQMARHGWITEAELASRRQMPLNVTLKRQSDVSDIAPHFVQLVRQQMLDWADANDFDLDTDGLVIHTTLDSRLQEAALKAVQRQADALQDVADVEWSRPVARVQARSAEAYRREAEKVEGFAHLWRSRPELLHDFIAASPDYKKAVAGGEAPAAALKRLQSDAAWVTTLKHEKSRLAAGFVAIDPASGEVRAWVGSRDFATDQFDHVAQAARQPGSTFKPFVYGAALEMGMGPERSYVDAPPEIMLGDGKLWRPTDMGAPTQQPMTLRDGLVQSKNTITVQVAQEVGVARVAALARSMGVDRSKLDVVPSLALGTSPVTLLEMVSAYSTLAHQGLHRKPLMVTRVSDSSGQELAVFAPDSRQTISAASAVELTAMMRGVITEGTGTLIRSRFGIQSDVAGKTGTSQNNIDGWFILMHPQLVAGAWVGFNDQRIAMRSSYWGQGGHNALLLVGDFYRGALDQELIDRKAAFPPSRRPPPQPSVLPADPLVDPAEMTMDPNGAPAVADRGARIELPAPFGEAPRQRAAVTAVAQPIGMPMPAAVQTPPPVGAPSHRTSIAPGIVQVPVGSIELSSAPQLAREAPALTAAELERVINQSPLATPAARPGND